MFNDALIADLRVRLADAQQRRTNGGMKKQAALDVKKERGSAKFNDSERGVYRAGKAEMEQADADITVITEKLREAEAEQQRAGASNPMVQQVLNGGSGMAQTSRGYAAEWATTALRQVRARGGGGEKRAVIGSGGVDVPSLLPIGVQAIPRPTRIIDLLVNRTNTPSYAYEAYIASARTNNAAPTADLANKPVSVNTLVPLLDHVRAHAHLSEPLPLRIWEDDDAIRTWLSTEMAQGVIDSIERDAIVSNGTNERQIGVLGLEGQSTPSDRTHVPFDTDVVTTLRSAITALQIIGVQPTGWVMHPTDAQAIDLLRWSYGPPDNGGAFLTGGYQTDTRQGMSGSSDNIFGPSSIPRVVSPSCPVGTAILADWSELGLWVYKGTTVDVDWYGDNFARNSVTVRAEAFVGVNVLRPKSFAIVDLTA